MAFDPDEFLAKPIEDFDVDSFLGEEQAGLGAGAPLPDPSLGLSEEGFAQEQRDPLSKFSEWFSDKVDKTTAEPIETAEDLGLGFGHGAAFGLGDEIAGATQAGLDIAQSGLHNIGLADMSPTQQAAALKEEGIEGDVGPTSTLELYRQARDAEKQKLAEASERSPWATGAGELAGGIMVPGMGIAKGAGAIGKVGTKVASKLDKVPLLGKLAQSKAAGLVGQGSVMGGLGGTLAGVGYSDADLTKGEFGEFGEDVGEMAGTGALIGGTLFPAAAGAAALGKGAMNRLRGLESVQKAGQALKISFMTGEELTGMAHSKIQSEVGELGTSMAAHFGENTGGKIMGGALDAFDDAGKLISTKPLKNAIADFKAMSKSRTTSKQDQKVYKEAIDYLEDVVNGKRQKILIDDAKKIERYQAQAAKLEEKAAALEAKAAPTRKAITGVDDIVDEKAIAKEQGKIAREQRKMEKARRDLAIKQQAAGEDVNVGKAELFESPIDEGKVPGFRYGEGKVKLSGIDAPQQPGIAPRKEQFTTENIVDPGKLRERQKLIADYRKQAEILKGRKPQKPGMGRSGEVEGLPSQQIKEVEQTLKDMVGKNEQAGFKVKQRVGDVQKNLQQELKDVVPEYRVGSDQYKNVARFEESAFGIKPFDDAAEKARKISNKLETFATGGGGAGDRQKFTNAIKEFAENSPDDWAKFEPIIKETGEKLGITNLTSKTGFSLVGAAGGVPATLASTVGLTGRGLLKFFGQDPQNLARFSQNISQKYGPRSNKLVSVLDQLVNQPTQKRAATMYMLMQNPEYREMMKDSSDRENQ